MKIRVDRQKCCGHARCASVASNLFILDDEGYIEPNDFEVPAGLEALAQRGVRACPERALAIDQPTTNSGEF